MRPVDPSKVCGDGDRRRRCRRAGTRRPFGVELRAGITVLACVSSHNGQGEGDDVSHRSSPTSSVFRSISQRRCMATPTKCQIRGRNVRLARDCGRRRRASSSPSRRFRRKAVKIAPPPMGKRTPTTSSNHKRQNAGQGRDPSKSMDGPAEAGFLAFMGRQAAGRDSSRDSTRPGVSNRQLRLSHSARTSASSSVDAQTGSGDGGVKYLAIDDCGPAGSHPMIAEGRCTAGICARSFAGRCSRSSCTTTTRQLLTGTLMD